MKEIKFTLHKEHLFGHLFSIKSKKTFKDQNRLKVSLLYLNQNVSQTLKSSSCNHFFLHCVYYRGNLLWWIFFNPCDNLKTLFLLKVCLYFEIFSTIILLLSLKQVFWRKSVFYVISTITVQCWCQCSTIKLSCDILILDKLL